MDLQINGKILSISEEITKGSFTKRDLIVVTDHQYPQTFQVEFTGDKGALLDFKKVGEEVQMKCNLRGRSWDNPEGETKYFLSIQCWSWAN